MRHPENALSRSARWLEAVRAMDLDTALKSALLVMSGVLALGTAVALLQMAWGAVLAVLAPVWSLLHWLLALLGVGGGA